MISTQLLCVATRLSRNCYTRTSSILPIPHSSFLVPHYSFLITHCRLPTAHVLPITYWLLPIAHILLTVNCPLPKLCDQVKSQSQFAAFYPGYGCGLAHSQLSRRARVTCSSSMPREGLPPLFSSSWISERWVCLYRLTFVCISTFVCIIASPTVMGYQRYITLHTLHTHYAFSKSPRPPPPHTVSAGSSYSLL